MSEIKTRNSGIELLRIIAACMVVLLHYNDGHAFAYVADVANADTKRFLLFFFESACVCAVDLFMLISGYFMCRSQKRTLIKPFDLYLQYFLLHSALSVLSQIGNWEGPVKLIKSILVHSVLNNYFVVLYIVVYFISPFVNLLLNKLDKTQWKKLLIILGFAFSIYAVGTDVYREIFDVEPMGMSTITAWGNYQGFNIVNFTLMYIIGAYLRMLNDQGHKLFSVRKSKMFLIWLADIALIFAWSLICQKLSHHGLRSSWVYHNPFVILSAVLLFVMFSKMKFSNRIINGLAKSSFTCFLFHGYLLPYIGIEWAVNQQFWIMLIHIIAVIPLVYLASWLVYKVYDLVTKPIIKRMAEWKIFQSFSI